MEVVHWPRQGTWTWVECPSEDPGQAHAEDPLSRPGSPRIPLTEAEALALRLRERLLASGIFSEVFVAGSIRRRSETCGDVDLVCVVPDGRDDWFSPGEVGRALFDQSAGSVRVDRWDPSQRRMSFSVSEIGGWVPVDVWQTHEDNVGCVLQHATGDLSFNVGLRRVARSRGMTVGCGGLRRSSSDWFETVASEEELFEEIGVSFVPPERRGCPGFVLPPELSEALDDSR